jgi:hypothetical protein
VTTEIVAEEIVAEQSMARPRREVKSAVSLVSGLGRQALVFDEDEIVHLLRAAVEREGSQRAFANRHGLNRTYVNKVLNGRARIANSLTKALGVRKAFVAEYVREGLMSGSGH